MKYSLNNSIVYLEINISQDNPNEYLKMIFFQKKSTGYSEIKYSSR